MLVCATDRKFTVKIIWEWEIEFEYVVLYAIVIVKLWYSLSNSAKVNSCKTKHHLWALRALKR